MGFGLGYPVVSLSLGTLPQGSLLITSLYGHTRLSLLSVKDPLCGSLEPVNSLCQSLSAGIIGEYFHAQSAFLPTGLQSLVTKSSWF